MPFMSSFDTAVISALMTTAFFPVRKVVTSSTFSAFSPSLYRLAAQTSANSKHFFRASCKFPNTSQTTAAWYSINTSFTTTTVKVLFFGFFFFKIKCSFSGGQREGGRKNHARSYQQRLKNTWIKNIFWLLIGNGPILLYSVNSCSREITFIYVTSSALFPPHHSNKGKL